LRKSIRFSAVVEIRLIIFAYNKNVTLQPLYVKKIKKNVEENFIRAASLYNFSL
jgi:hypothetical protein